jgi:peroxiredoxin family protein
MRAVPRMLLEEVFGMSEEDDDDHIVEQMAGASTRPRLSST